MMLDVSPDELLTTTRAVRNRLDLTRPVDRSVIEECIRIAVQAPTGSNLQRWHWVVLEDPEKKRAIADLYRRSFEVYAQQPGPDFDLSDTRAQRRDAVRGSASYLAEHFHEVPAQLIPCSEGRLAPDAPTSAQAGFWGSLLPAVWSFMLALRARGLGSAWTTLHLVYEREAAEILGIPYDRVTQAGLFPIAYTQGTDFKPAPRRDVGEIIHWDGW